MSQIVVGEELCSQFNDLSGAHEVADPNGKLLGYSILMRTTDIWMPGKRSMRKNLANSIAD